MAYFHQLTSPRNMFRLTGLGDRKVEALLNIPAHVGAAHEGLLQKRPEEDIC